jgi:hypothetical protein
MSGHILNNVQTTATQGQMIPQTVGEERSSVLGTANGNQIFYYIEANSSDQTPHYIEANSSHQILHLPQSNYFEPLDNANSHQIPHHVANYSEPLNNSECSIPAFEGEAAQLGVKAQHAMIDTQDDNISATSGVQHQEKHL